MDGPFDVYGLTPLERVVSGAGSVSALGAECDALQASRVVVVTGRTLGGSSLLERVTGSLGDRCVAVFRDARQHVPASSVDQLAHLLDTQRADGVVSFGGGSPIDTAKAAVHARLGRASSVPAPSRAALPHVAVPTTLSAGEFTAVAGVTDEQTRIKHAISDPRLVPRAVVLDPSLTLETPSWLWTASAVRAVDHAVETLYSARQHPVSSALASRGLALMIEHLPASTAGDGEARLFDRLQCQIAAWMSVCGIAHAGLGLSHALGHQIGPKWKVAHGITSCITLPHVARMMALRAPERFEGIAAGLGLPFDRRRPAESAAVCADRLGEFIGALGLPTCLGDVGVPRDELDGVAGVVHEIMSHAAAVGESFSREAITAVLYAAY